MAKFPTMDPALAQLRDIHLPNPIGLWPLAPGWYLLLLLGILALVVMYRWYQKGQVKRSALALLAEYRTQYLNEGCQQEIAAKVSDVLRRVVLVYFPRKDVAGLQGKDWIDFLNKTSKGLDFNEIHFLLASLPYAKKTSSATLEPLFTTTKAWIKQRGGHV